MANDICPAEPLSLVVLVSGSGSNLQAIIDAIADTSLDASIKAVISNRSDAYGLERARQANIPTFVHDHQQWPDRQTYDNALGDRILSLQPDLIILAGFMRIFSAGFVSRFRDKILNIHPSLLPQFKGVDTHQQALDSGVVEHGASVHLVTEELDGGPVIDQITVPVLPGDDAASLGARVLTQEHCLYPRVIQRIATGEIEMVDGRVLVGSEPQEAVSG